MLESSNAVKASALVEVLAINATAKNFAAVDSIESAVSNSIIVGEVATVFWTVLVRVVGGNTFSVAVIVRENAVKAAMEVRECTLDIDSGVVSALITS